MFGWFKKKQKKQNAAVKRRANDEYDYMARKKWEDISYPHRREENSLLDPVVPAVVLASMISENNQESVSESKSEAGVECVEDRNSNVSVCDDRNTVSSYDPSPSYESSTNYSDSGSNYSDSGGSYSSGD